MFAMTRNFTLDVIERVSTVGMEVRVAEYPALWRQQLMSIVSTERLKQTYVFTERTVV